MGKRYGSRWLFRNISFELTKGSSLVVLGPNGSGKSTLLRIIAGLLPATEGVVIHSAGDTRRGLGVSTLEMALYPALTCVEHLELAGDLRGCEPRAQLLLDSVGLAHAARLTPLQMSTGMKSRLRLALATQAEPPVLLFDEPGASMDELGRDLVARLCEEQVGRGALILATNDPAERRLATSELVLA